MTATNLLPLSEKVFPEQPPIVGERNPRRPAAFLPTKLGRGTRCETYGCRHLPTLSKLRAT